ncbi:MAG: dTDP-4-dehydrorhamnose 3,5-epimerase family protein [candidate division KSB1 bacterium]|nr:dTDP-4-dehydrorhamnose 3,5-epimerase family protein [candidate division KSB1 bacterium]MDZ7365828.1 dTDP-4-dehydrorhamnose 3,5-epimerase family protein [candidate division KSB1 bacterium]MDZ7403937.1 dTDP-4-dehydrorhamnose 3,5-epimerase family protein [candidate division KSB1 bacterium]
MIEGVEIKDLVTIPDERGFFREIIRKTDAFFVEGFGQLSHACMYPGVAKAWHIHKVQTDWWYVPIGNLKLVLFDKRPHSSTQGELQTIFMGENYPTKVVKIPPGVAHGCKALGGVTHLFYVTSSVYDPNDEGRIPHYDNAIGYDWLAGPEIK